MLSLSALPGLNKDDLRSLLDSGKLAELHLADTESLPVQRIVEIATEYNLKMLTHPDMYSASLALADRYDHDPPVETPAIPFGRGGSLPISQVLYFNRYHSMFTLRTTPPPMSADSPGLPWSSFVGHLDHDGGVGDRKEPWSWSGLNIIPMLLYDTFMPVERLLSLPEIVRFFAGDSPSLRGHSLAYAVCSAARRLALAVHSLPFSPMLVLRLLY